MALKILILGLNYTPEPTGIAVYTAGLAKELAANGHVVEVVTGYPYYPDWKVKSGYSASRFQREIVDGISIVRCPLYVPNNPTGLKRIVHHLSFAVSAFFPTIRAAMKLKPDLVFTIVPSLIAAPVAKIAAKLGGAKSWLHVQDFEVEAAIATGQLPGKAIVSKSASWFEKTVFGMFDKLSSISPQMCKKLVHKGVKKSAVYELRNWADLDMVRFEPDSLFREKWNISTPNVALYSGSIAEKQGIETIIEVARLMAERDDLTFIICGNGPNRARLEKMAADCPNLQFHDLQPIEQLNSLLNLATIHLLPQKAGAADLVLPSKLTNMLASGRPVLAGAEAGTGLAAEVEGCGLIFEPGSAESMADGILQLLDDSSSYDRYSKAALERAEERWSLKKIIGNLLVEIEKITQVRANTLASTHTKLKDE
ncbi:WcaI family glycosyltransferase [Parasphingorhabdus sp.]|uniref:WcaI family glycosyltransferase n=1 Tax=Parasphingorhabdus sp. TaxID=2709688 RepID=UPI003D266495